MAFEHVSGDGDGLPDFHDILEDEEDEDVADMELEHDKAEYLEAKWCDEAGGTVEAEEATEAEPYIESNEPAQGIGQMSNKNLDRLAVTSRSPPLPRSTLTSTVAGSGSSPALQPFVVVVTGPFDGDIAMKENHVFHLADEHQLFQQAEGVKKEVTAEQPQRRHRPWRGDAAQRCRGKGRGSRSQVPSESGGPQCVRGERLVEVNINDDDVPEYLRKMIMRVEKGRVRMTEGARRLGKENEQESILDADDGEVETFFATEGTSNHFEWSPMADYQGEREQFLPQQTGAAVASKNAYGAFRQYWDDGIMTHIVTVTNRYAAGLAGSSATFAQDWYDTNIHELFVLFSFWMMLGIIRMPSITSCFSLNPLLQTNIFRKMFSRGRYENLCRVFHLNDSSSRPTDSTDRLNSLGPIIPHLNDRFQQAYIPSQNICIDESLTLWKGNLSFRLYIKTKAAQYSVKTFELCESSTGYLWSFFVYLGAGKSCDSSLPSTTLKSSNTVLKLVRPLLDKGYTLFMDSWFNSPLLARFLKTRKTDCVGTLRANRSNVPPLVSLCKLKEGQFVARHSGDVVVLAFQEKKCKIATISTYHGDSQGLMEAKPHRPALYKPQAVLDYNKSMGGVDRKDQTLEPYLLERKRCSKWNIKFFKHLLYCSILNARILLQSSTATLKEQMVFQLELVDQILRHHLENVPKIRPILPVSSSLGHPQPQVQHFSRETDQVTNDGRRKRRRCIWCSKHNKVRRTTAFSCSVCDVSLCTTPCFELYHRR